MTEPEQPLSRRARREAEAAAARRRRGRSDARTPADAAPADPSPVVPSAASSDSRESDTANLGAPTVALEAAGSVATAPTPDDAPRGIRAVIRSHPRAVLATALGVGFLLVATGSLFAGVAVGSAQGAPVAVATNSPTETPGARVVPGFITDPTRLRTCSIASLAADERLSSLFGSVVNSATGEVLFDRSGSTPTQPAGTQKVLTAAAALAVLGPDFRLSTRVVAGTTPGTVVLVGGGDATLSRLPAGQESVYSGAPKLDDLAAQVVAAYALANPDEPGITTVVVDATYWSAGDSWNPRWNRDRIAAGIQAPATALMVDGDRADPRQQISPRSNDPVARAAQAFAEALDAAGNPTGVPTINSGSAVGGTVLGQVQSQPVSTLVTQMLSATDFVLAEMLARVTSKQLGLAGSTASLTAAVTGGLDAYGVPTEGIVVTDGSGLATDNSVPMRYLAGFFAVANARTSNLGIIMDALPVAGTSGSLAGRFGGPNAVARGAVTAMPGDLPTAQALAGVVRAADGTVLTIGFSAVRDGIGTAGRDAIDSLTAAVVTCGDNLSNN